MSDLDDLGPMDANLRQYEHEQKDKAAARYEALIALKKRLACDVCGLPIHVGYERTHGRHFACGLPLPVAASPASEARETCDDRGCFERGCDCGREFGKVVATPSPRSSDEPKTWSTPSGAFVATLTPAPHTQVVLGNRRYILGAFQGMENQWVEEKADGGYRAALAKEWLDRIAELESALSASQQREAALREDAERWRYIAPLLAVDGCVGYPDWLMLSHKDLPKGDDDFSGVDGPTRAVDALRAALSSVEGSRQ